MNKILFKDKHLTIEFNTTLIKFNNQQPTILKLIQIPDKFYTYGSINDCISRDSNTFKIISLRWFRFVSSYNFFFYFLFLFHSIHCSRIYHLNYNHISIVSFFLCNQNKNKISSIWKFSLFCSKLLQNFSVIMKSSLIYQGKFAQTTNVPCHIFFRSTVLMVSDVSAFDEYELLYLTTVRSEHSAVSKLSNYIKHTNAYTYTVTHPQTHDGAPQYNRLFVSNNEWTCKRESNERDAHITKLSNVVHFSFLFFKW